MGYIRSSRFSAATVLGDAIYLIHTVWRQLSMEIKQQYTIPAVELDSIFLIFDCPNDIVFNVSILCMNRMTTKMVEQVARWKL